MIKVSRLQWGYHDKVDLVSSLKLWWSRNKTKVLLNFMFLYFLITIFTLLSLCEPETILWVFREHIESDSISWPTHVFLPEELLIFLKEEKIS